MKINKIIKWGFLGAILILFLCVIFLQRANETKHAKQESWTVSPYPNGYDFAFTIISDADSQYSKRLAPLIDTFDGLGLKVTVTIFTHTGDEWFEKQNNQALQDYNNEDRDFFGPRNLPLSTESERQFYLEIASKGHEIGMHTPSATSDRRQKLIQAFIYFKDVFGYYPRIYVEHWGKGSKETQANEGADPTSKYYSTDILNRYGSWIWVDGKGALTSPKHGSFYNLLASNNGSPFSQFVLKKYGILKGFVRTGKWKNSNGDGFLDWYTIANIDSLESNRGLALVYAHFDKKWVDPVTRQTREEIKQRLVYLASKNGWFVPAGEILDRFEALEKVTLSYNSKWLKITNANSFPIEGMTLLSHANQSLQSSYGEVLAVNDDNEIVFEKLMPYETESYIVIPR